MRQKPTRKIVFLLLGITLMAANLRAPIVAAGTVFPEIQEALQLSPSLVSLLTTIPLLCFAFGSVLMPKLSEKMGLERTLLYAIVLLIIGSFIRPLGNAFFLFTGSVFIGIAITIANVLMPAFIKKNFPNKVGNVTAVYLTAMNLASSIAVGYSVNMGKIGGLGWKASIGIWGFLAVLAFFSWIPALNMSAPAEVKPQKRDIKTMWKSRLAWQISILMGTQSVVFYVMAAWFPTILQDWGMNAEKAGWMLAYVQMGQVPMMLIGPLLTDRIKKQTVLVWASFLALLFGLLLLIIWQARFAAVAAILIGTGVGLAFALCTMFFAIRTQDVDDAADLSGMAQSIGYLMAACFPPLFGFLFSWLDSWYVALLILLGIDVLLLLTGLPSAQDEIVSTEATESE